jgi:hypothetical protein
MIIHFFRNRSLERLDYSELIDNYFDTLDNSKITSNEDEVEISFPFLHFDSQYRYLITKRSRVSSLYRLSSNYVNLNLLCEIPVPLPEFLYKQVLKQISDLCDKFSLQIYCNGFDDIVPFNMFNMLKAMADEKKTYFEEHPEVKKYVVEQSVLNCVCSYQYFMDKIPSMITGDVIIHPYEALFDHRMERVVFSIKWTMGTPMVFPEFISYVCIEEEENLFTIVPKDVFYKHMEKQFYEIKEESLGIKMDYMNEKLAQKAKKLVKKMRKLSVSVSNFDNISLKELTEE